MVPKIFCKIYEAKENGQVSNIHEWSLLHEDIYTRRQFAQGFTFTRVILFFLPYLFLIFLLSLLPLPSVSNFFF